MIAFYHRVRGFVLCFTVFALCAGASACATGNAILGTWEGELSIPGASLTLVFVFEANEDGAVSGVLHSPTQGVDNIPLGEVLLQGPKVHVSVPSLVGNYDGEMSEDGVTIHGTWSQSGKVFPLALVAQMEVAELRPKDPPCDLSGSWLGLIELGGSKLRIVFHFNEPDGGQVTGTLDSVDQGVTGIPLGRISWSEDSITVYVPTLSGVFRGDVHESGVEIDGFWDQGGQALPLKIRSVGD